MNAREIMPAVKTRKAGRAQSAPKRAPTAANKPAVRSSTAGYRGDIEVPQVRHFPPRISQEMTGILSRSANWVPQLGHLDRGRTIDSLRGTRWMTTLRNEPTASPN